MSKVTIPRNYEGWSGAHVREEYPGAMPNGTKIVKVNSERGDSHKNGEIGTIIGSIGSPEIGIAYFIEWANLPKTAVLTIEKKVSALQ